jgi:serine/threonine protein kinase/ABC-type branched-subunit amino acid transport system substrate-binding protein
MVPDDKTRIRDDPNDQPPLGSTRLFVAPPAGSDPLVGRVLNGAYRIEGRIGEGGMGVVYRATQVALGRPVAVKTINLDSRIPASGVDRFFREGRLLSQLQHPNIVQIIDFGSEAGSLHFLVMEYLEGESLETFVTSRERLAPDLVLALMEQLCAGVAAAHQANVIHRDLKPSNIHTINISGSRKPLLKILDFGLGKMLAVEHETVPAGLTREGVMMGTCGYSAPEQLHGGAVDARADIYSLGAILYFLVSGRPPYLDEGFRATLVKQLTHPPDPLEPDAFGVPITRAVEVVIHKAMSARPEDRYPTANELLADLDLALGQGDTVADRPSWLRGKPTPEARKSTAHPFLAPAPLPPSKSRRWLSIGVVVLAAVLLGVGGWLLSRPVTAPDRHARATAPGVTDTEIVIGLSAPFSGPTRELGGGIRAGIETFFGHVNQSGGIHGRRLRLVALDDGYEPDRARENVRRLIEEEKVFAFLGNVGTPTTTAALPLLLENKRVLFGAYTGARFLRKDPPDRYVFNYRAGYSDETSAIVHYLLEFRNIAPDQIAVFAQKDAYGNDGAEGVAKALRRHHKGGKQFLQVGYERNKVDVSEAVAAIVKARSKIKAVVMVATYEPAARFIQQVKDAGLDVIFTNVSFVGSEALAENLRKMGPKYTEGVIVTQVVPMFTSNATGVLRYKEDMRTFNPSETPGFVSLEGYIAASIFVEGLKNAGVNLTSETLVEGLEKIHDLDRGIGAKITFGPSDHQGSHRVWGTRLDKEGRYEELDLEYKAGE